MSRRAAEVLESVEAIAGYTTYIDLIRPLIQGKQIVSTAMKKEVDRVSAALDLALSGTACAVVSSGDPGVYAMAGLVLEMCRERSVAIGGSDRPENANRLAIEVVPGIPALCSGASLLGAPLTHDFAAISLSDLLTPWETIQARLEAAARADFVIVIYNPKSRRRTDHLTRAQEIFLKHRDASTPVGIVTGAMRDNQRVTLTTLGELHRAEVDMQTTVFVGNSNTFDYDGFMITPRGYAKKYNIGD
ncbi:precorrin-3B C(17)-methyltransferase [Desulfosarcina ovata]|uniref:Precorrin-3B C(17)-methyltransferase n=1 Tax=Desulfosarcina ovata subsp. ovata TaxID=2752305 RepID=A0A5K8A7W0_9BACT|nr:precorrin-3B C(17)-methyltransferase [Desulfosarcina ovata]BBO88444.1 precorrin-3B C(17)-methyltransferase [Desulfosarcina ovata subsp. ovata]